MTMMDAKRNYVIEKATELFLERSIAGTTIKDIAGATGLGEATVYRYFSNKSEIVVSSALKLQKVVTNCFVDAGGAQNGFERLQHFYEAYLSIFRESPHLYRFLGEFDAFCISGNVPLDEYADNMDRFKDIFLAAYHEGVSDGSVRPTSDIELFYYSTAHALLALCKRSASTDGILWQDKLIDKASEIEMLTNIILSYLDGAK